MTNYAARTPRAQARRADIAAWIRLIAALLMFVVAITIVGWYLPQPADGTDYPVTGPGYDSEQNHPEYWGDDCEKTEDGLQGPRWYTPVNEGYRLVVLKSGLVNDVFYDVPADTQLSTVSGKDVSHVIYCGPTTPPTTTTEPPVVTTTLPPTTTAPPVTTTTICQEDEPCWDCETMGNGICGPVPTTTTEAPVPTPVTPSEPALPVPATPQLTG